MIRMRNNPISAKSSIPGSYTRQRGTALIISLVVLLLLTMLGVSALNMSSLETLITRNDQQKQRAFMEAEDALNRGRKYADTLVLKPISNGVQGDGNSNVAVYTSLDLSSLDWNSGATVVTSTSGYVIEYLKMLPSPCGGDSGTPCTIFYRVVGRSNIGNADTQVESIYGVLGAY